MKKGQCVDLHIHTNESFDGSLTVDEALAGAKENGVSLVAFPNHNIDNREIWKSKGRKLSSPVEVIDGVTVICASEVTCRIDTVLNKENNTTKVHYGIYGADMSPNSPLSRLLAIKRANDRQCDLGLLDFIISVKNIKNISENDIRDFMREKRQEIPGFSSLGKESVWEFLNKKGITVSKSYKEFSELCSRAPWHDRLNLSAEDVVKIAHASGGMVIMMHPWENLERVRDKSFAVMEILRMGIDGFEIFSPTMTDDVMAIIKRCVKSFKSKNKIVYTGGSDTHDFGRGNKIGRLHYLPLYREAVADFENEIMKLKNAKQKGKSSSRTYPKVTDAEIEGIIKYYKQAYLYLDDVAEATALGRTIKIEKPKKEHKKKKESLKSSKMRPGKKDRRLDGARYDIEDFESVHDYLGAISDDLGENVYDNPPEDETYEEYLERMNQVHSVNIPNIMEEDSELADD
ncbi:MAG: hypothetical protein IJW59_01290 [Clostridia bacterium]|nr:hypothetical protein [Clostridia bacterium]